MPNAHDLRAQAQSIIDQADDEGRDTTVSENNRVEKLLDEAAAATSRGRRVSREQLRIPEGMQNQHRSSARVYTPGTGQLHSFGDFVQNVRHAFSPGSRAQSARNALTTYGSEATGPDGGFAIPPDYRSNILQKVTGEASLFSLCDHITTSSNGIVFPRDETPPWTSSTTGGIRAYWTGEAAQMTQSKPLLEKDTISIEKLTCMVPVSDELLEDAPALGTFVQRKAADVIDLKVSDAIVNGTGAGAPLGFMNSPCLITVAKETSQVAATIHGLNLIAMWARMPAAWRSTAVWLTHPDAEVQLMQAGLQIKSPDGVTVVGGGTAWLPSGSISGSPYATLFGRPVIPTQVCQAVGTKGDLIFASLSQYAAVTKAPALKSDSSIHVFFDYGVTAFRFTFRMGGQPWWSAPLAAKNGNTTYSPFVTLDSRS